VGNAKGITLGDTAASFTGGQIYSVSDDIRFFTVTAASVVERMRVDTAGVAVTGTLSATGTGSAEYRYTAVRGTDDSTQKTHLGWGGVIVERTGVAVASVQPFTITVRGTSDVVPLSASSTGVAITGALSATSTTRPQGKFSYNGTSGLFLTDATTGAYVSWEIGASQYTGGSLSFTPSTTVGGTTFTTPVMNLSSTGLAVTGALSASSDIRASGTSAANYTNTLVMDQASANSSRLLAFGSDGTTQGSLSILNIANDGSPATTHTFSSTGLAVTGVYEGAEQTAPSAPAANRYRIFAQDNGAGKTQLMVIFASGAAQQIAIEP
jgi:hypothetical protein